MFTKFRTNEKGFTLIELLIVVAIIGILAAIAIPQFSAYRIRGFNAAATSDVRNAATGEEALFADTQGYGSTVSAVLAVGDAVATGAILTGPLNGAITGTAGAMVQNGLGAVPFSVSNGVLIGSSHTVAGAVGSVLGTSYILVSKHTAGDSCYGRDSDSTSMLRASGVAATALVAANQIASTAGTDNLTGVASGGTACTGNYAAM